ncbi:MAG: endonuclease V [Chitinophagales bacterium]|nr:endonuclease V [Chitinophagales bacterium]
MILAIDVHYKEGNAKVVGVLFNWEDENPKEIITTEVHKVEEYQSGQFYKRELPCILSLLKQIDLSILEVIIVDGHCYVSNDKKLGLGGYLYEALERKIPIIGVAKKSFHNTEKVSNPVYRGNSKVPLFVSSIGIDIEFITNKVLKMYGNYRIPTILKQLDRLTKS